MKALDKAISIAGGATRLAETLDVSSMTVSHWRHRDNGVVPANRVIPIFNATGVTPHGTLYAPGSISMSDSLNNKELVLVGRDFAKALSSDTPIIDIAKVLSRLADRLDVTAAALREKAKQRDALATENAGLKAKGREVLTEACSACGTIEIRALHCIKLLIRAMLRWLKLTKNKGKYGF